MTVITMTLLVFLDSPRRNKTRTMSFLALSCSSISLIFHIACCSALPRSSGQCIHDRFSVLATTARKTHPSNTHFHALTLVSHTCFGMLDMFYILPLAHLSSLGLWKYSIFSSNISFFWRPSRHFNSKKMNEWIEQPGMEKHITYRRAFENPFKNL